MIKEDFLKLNSIASTVKDKEGAFVLFDFVIQCRFNIPYKQIWPCILRLRTGHQQYNKIYNRNSWIVRLINIFI